MRFQTIRIIHVYVYVALKDIYASKKNIIF